MKNLITMKKDFFLITSMFFALIFATSCKKPSKAKVTNFWKITSFKTVETDIESYTGSTYSATTSMEGTADSFTQTGGGSITQGTIKTHTFNIKPDGTWILQYEYTTETSQGNSTISHDILSVQSGTWAFLAKDRTKQFKDNKRIIFNLLKETKSNVSTNTTLGTPSTSQTSTSNSENTYLSGESALIYTITSSTSKELKLSMDGNQSYTDSSAPNDVERFITNSEMVLEKN